MAELRYKSRIHKNKFSFRTIRYALADQLVRLWPRLQRRWLFPTEAVPMREAAERSEIYPTLGIDQPPPPAVERLVKRIDGRLAARQVIHQFSQVTVLGQSGANIKDGRLLANREHPNWAVSLRPRRLTVRPLPDDRLYYNLITPAPATGHVFHWLFDYVLPFSAWLQRRAGAEPVSPLVNAASTEFQRRTLEFLQPRFGLLAPQPVAQDEAVLVQRLAVTTYEPMSRSALQVAEGLRTLDDLAVFLSQGAADPALRRRLYISRLDAKLRRVVNEERLLPLLAAHGFERVILRGKPIAEQVRLFMEAEAVVAPHGAGLMHIAWCRPGAKVIEFFPSPHGPRGAPKNATGNFWIAASMRGLAYEAHEGGVRLNKHDAFEIPEALLAGRLNAFRSRRAD